jgi:hypothetical protein
MNTQYSQLNNPRVINTELKAESSKNLIEVQNPLNMQAKPNQPDANPQPQYFPPKKGNL